MYKSNYVLFRKLFLRINLCLIFCKKGSNSLFCVVLYLQSAKILLLPSKIRNDYVANRIINFSNIAIAILEFSLWLLNCKVITLNPLCILFGISSLLFFMALFLMLSFFLALKGDSENITVSFRKCL